MKYLFVAFLAAVLCGCGGQNASEQKPPSNADAVKRNVADLVHVGKREPKSLAVSAAQVLKTLENIQTKASGDEKQIITDLTKLCREVAAAAKTSPASADVKKKLDDMEALAKKL